jgi:uncharacterized protein YbjQ (UPF0145 family)
MDPSWSKGWGPQFDRIAAGGLAWSTEERLKELTRWGGFTSFMTPAALAVGADAEVVPVAQVVGLATGSVRPGYLRTTRPGQGRARVGVARSRERSGPVAAWTGIRSRALARLTEQASTLGADAVVGITAERRLQDVLTGGESDREIEAGVQEAVGQWRFVGTAVRVRALAREKTPVLTLATPQELWAMLRAGVHPAGIAGGFASVETTLSSATLAARSPTAPNTELQDVTQTMYEVRRLAMQRLVADAKGLGADGLVGVDLQIGEGGGPEDPGPRLPSVTLTAHVLASAVRRVSPAPLAVEPVLTTRDGARG